MLHLVNCEVVKSYYQGDTKRKEVNHIVEAESEEEANSKVEEFYTKQDSEFYVSFDVNINYCNPLI